MCHKYARNAVILIVGEVAFVLPTKSLQKEDMWKNPNFGATAIFLIALFLQRE